MDTKPFDSAPRETGNKLDQFEVQVKDVGWSSTTVLDESEHTRSQETLVRDSLDTNEQATLD